MRFTSTFVFYFFLLIAYKVRSTIETTGDRGILGTSCSDTQPCEDNFVCQDEKCICNLRTVRSVQDKACLKVKPGFREKCSEENDCTDTLICEDGDCVCPKDFTYLHSNGTCVMEKAVDEGIPNAWGKLSSSCSNQEPCEDDFVCQDEKCVCPPGTVHSIREIACLREAVRLYEQCQETVQCRRTLGEHAMCLNEECVCNEDAVPIKNACMRKPTIDNLKCKVHMQCSEAFDDNSICRKSKCTCIEGYFLNKDSKTCAQYKGLFENCQNNAECGQNKDELEKRTLCIANKCKCMEGFSPSSDKKSCMIADSATTDTVSAGPSISYDIIVWCVLIAILILGFAFVFVIVKMDQR